MKEASGFRTDAELASHLEVSNKTVSSWRARNSLPIEAILQVSEETGKMIEFFLRGISDKRPETDFKFSDMRLRDFELAGIPVFFSIMSKFAPEDLAFLSDTEIDEYGKDVGISILGALAIVRQERRALLDAGVLDEEMFDEYIAKALRTDQPHSIRAIRNRQRKKEGPQ